MGIQLNIKSEEAYALASKIAEAEGVSLTQAVIEALRRREREVSADGRFARAMEIIKDMRSRMSPELLALDINDYLYDENGLPK
jgi:antitoxin VapB